MKKLVVVGVVLLFVVFLVLNSCSTVKSTERAVSVMFGKVQEDKDIHAGLNFKLPFVESIKKYSIEPNQINLTLFRVYTQKKKEEIQNDYQKRNGRE